MSSYCTRLGRLSLGWVWPISSLLHGLTSIRGGLFPYLSIWVVLLDLCDQIAAGRKSHFSVVLWSSCHICIWSLDLPYKKISALLEWPCGPAEDSHLAGPPRHQPCNGWSWIPSLCRCQLNIAETPRWVYVELKDHQAESCLNFWLIEPWSESIVIEND